MSKYYNPIDGRHIPNPLLRTKEWAGIAHIEAPEYDGREYICYYNGAEWILLPNTENQTDQEVNEAAQREALIQMKIREIAKAELIKEGKLDESGNLVKK